MDVFDNYLQTIEELQEKVKHKDMLIKALTSELMKSESKYQEYEDRIAEIVGVLEHA